MREGVLTLGGLRQVLAVIRSLTKAGYAVTVGEECPGFVSRSRYVDGVWRHGEIGSGRAFVEELLGLLRRRPDIRYVFPTGDTPLACLARHYDRLAPRATLVMPEPTAVLTCMDKARMGELARRMGAPVPTTRVAGNMEELEDAVERIGYPCVIKPLDSLGDFFGYKAIICRGAAERRRRLPAWPADGRPLLVQRYIWGRRTNCSFAAWDGEIRARFQWRVHRTQRHDYTGIAVAGRTEPPIAVLWERCRRLARELRYTGLALVQFLQENDQGEQFFLEFNPRMSASVSFICRCGLDFPLWALRCGDHVAGRSAREPAWKTSYPFGRRVHWFYGDLEGWLQCRAGLTCRQRLRWLYAMARSKVRGDAPLTWSARDPRPTLWLYRKLLMDGLRSPLGRLTRRREPAAKPGDATHIFLSHKENMGSVPRFSSYSSTGNVTGRPRRMER